MLRMLRVVDARVEKAHQRDAKKAARAAEKEQQAFEREAARCKQAGLPAPQKSKILKQCAPSSDSCRRERPSSAIASLSAHMVRGACAHYQSVACVAHPGSLFLIHT